MKPRILLINDDSELVQHISQILKLANYEIIHSQNGVDGVEKALSTLPDLIISGVTLTGLNGYGVIQILSLNEQTERIPFIFISKNVKWSEIRLGMNYGADDFISDKIGEGNLLKTVELRLKKRCILSRKSQKEDPAPVNTLKLNIEPEDIYKLFENRRSRFFKKRDFIFMEGQSPGNLYLIKSGKIKIFKTNSFGKELITNIQGADEFLGYLPLLMKAPYEENAEALEDVELQIISKTEFLPLLYANLGLALFFIQLLSKELLELEHRMIDLAYQPVRQRAARVLLNLGSQFEKWGNSNSITMSRKDISNIIGTAPETLNRMLSEFKNEGLIELNNDSGLSIINIKGLLKVAEI